MICLISYAIPTSETIQGIYLVFLTVLHLLKCKVCFLHNLPISSTVNIETRDTENQI